MTGRISDFLPFLPFTLGEQAVVVHKFLLDMAQQIRGPVNLSFTSEQRLLGNIRMKIQNDASVCRILAEEQYHSELGARSLRTGAKKLEDILVESYLDIDGEITEDATLVDFLVELDIDGTEVVGKIVR